MEYREDRKGHRLSILGYGCMRFTKNGSAVDLDKAEQELMYAIRHGVNYLDTAYVYAGNEEAVGTILERNHCRRDIFLATKLPHYLIKSRAGAQKKFEEELRRLRTDYIDFYLMHMLNDVKTWESLVRIGIADWIAEKKVSGEIRSIGFSYHGNSENFRALLDAYDWDFCQIQYNYMDTDIQAGDKGYALAEKKGIPMVIMEPVRGGLLAGFSEDINEVFKKAAPDKSVASWAVRWVASHPNVKVVLSGMSTPEQVEDNLKTFNNFEPLSESEEATVEQVVKTLKSRVQNGCTGCRYCMPCPAGVDIPGNFRIWNDYHIYQNYGVVKNRWENELGEDAKPVNCAECGACEEQCPQKITIREHLKRVQEELDHPVWK